MADRSTLVALAEALSDAFDPLVLATESENAFIGFMRFLGWNAAGVIHPVNDLAGLVASARELITDDGVDPAQIPELVGRLGRTYSAIRALTSLDAATLGAAIDVNEFHTDFPTQLLDFLIVDYLQHRRPKMGRLLQLFGILRLRDVAQTATRPAYVRREIDWHALVAALRDPTAPFRTAYGFGQSDFDGAAFLDALYELARGHGLDVRIGTLTAAERAFLSAGAAPGAITSLHNSVIRWVVADNPFDLPTISAGLGVAITPETPGQKPGFAVLPFVEGTESTAFLLTPDVVAEMKAAFSFAGGVALRVRPDAPPALDTGFDSGTAAGSAEFSLGVELLNSNNQRRVLLGDPAASRLEIGKLALRGGIRVQSGSNPVAFIELEAQDAEIVIEPAADEADGFLTSILPSPLRAGFGGTLTFDAVRGLYFTGSSGLEVQLPVHVSLGPIELQAAQIFIRPADAGGSASIPIELTATLAADLGPLKGVIENVGMRVDLTFPDGGGGLGPLDFSFGFRAPNGVGLSLDVGVVRGGGYLFFDFDRQEYAGVLELAFAGIVTVKAIGLITTKMPDGSKGFSLLIIITAEFGTGIQLGFGFTLLGVGGLLGLNRTMNLHPLMEGVRSGAVNSIMFPENPVTNAPRIISDLRVFFPPYEGRFLIGPMAKLGWGTPKLISVSLGIVIEITGNIAIVGVLKVALPAEDAPLIVIQANFAGAIEFDKQRLYFFASLYESRIVFLTLEGELGLLVAWGPDANFVVSVGGFHPRFNPPPLPFPAPKRIAVSLINTDLARIRTETYFAVTSNTVQFGSSTELMFDVEVAQVEGHLAFDALFQFSPFYFVIEISGSVSLKVFGLGLFSIHLQFSLSGPTPYRAHGTGSLSLFFFDVSADFDTSWGDSQDTSLPPVPVMPLLQTEFAKAESWKAELPIQNNLLVSLRKLPETESAQVLHPLGALRVSQRAVPFALKIDKVGNQKPSDANEFKLTPVSGLVKAGEAQEQFAKAQFLNMSDADKLSQRAFDPMNAGLLLCSGAQALGATKLAKRRVRYEEIIIDTNLLRFRRRFKIVTQGFFNHFMKGAAIGKSHLSKNYKTQLDPFVDKVKVTAGGFTVAYTETNAQFSVEAAYFSSEALANQYIREQVAAHPDLHESLHVIAQYEAAA